VDAWPALIASGLAVALGVAAVGALADVTDGQLTGLGSLLGGWRPQSWPTGIQEDDPETSRARQSESGRPDEVPAGTVDRSRDEAGPDHGFLSWIEELD
jgi:hypothetical protein